MDYWVGGEGLYCTELSGWIGIIKRRWISTIRSHESNNTALDLPSDLFKFLLCKTRLHHSIIKAVI